MKSKQAIGEEVNERPALYINGWIALLLGLALLFWLGSGFIGGIIQGAESPAGWRLVAFVFTVLFLGRGLTTLEPNQAAVLTFFGKYAGTIRRDGIWYFNPLCGKRKLSLRVVNSMTPTLKVNDLGGNPLDVAAVIVWAIDDTARAAFAVDNYERFLGQQAESALRQVVGGHPYDSEERGQGLRANIEGVSTELKDTIGMHVAVAGIDVRDARLAHLAYAPEIAGVMLRRQQAEAVLAARRKIVEGAVSLVTHAVQELQSAKVVELDGAQRGQLVINLMTMLVAETDAQPVLPMSSVPNAQ